MAFELYVNFGDLDQLAAQLQTQASDLRSTLTNVRGKANPDHMWRGAAATAYTDRLTQWATHEDALITHLDALASIVRRFSEAMQRGDQDGAVAILNNG